MRWREATGSLCAALVLIVATGCTETGEKQAPPTQTGSTVPVQEGVKTRAVSADGRLVVEIGGESISGSGSLTLTPATHSNGTDGYTIELAGAELNGAAKLTFSVPDAEPGMPAPLVTYAPSPDADPIPIEEVEFDGQTVTVTATHFSWWGVRAWNELMDYFRNSLDALYSGRAAGKQPKCNGEDRVRQDGYTVTSDSGGRVMWCLGEEDDGAPVLKLANARGYAVTMENTPGLTLMTHEQGDLVDDISQWLAPPPTLPQNVVSIVPPGQDVVFQITADESQYGVMIKPSPAAYLVSAAQFAIDTVAEAFEYMGFKGVTREALGAALDTEVCFAGLRSMAADEITNSLEAANYLNDAIATALGCTRRIIEEQGLDFWGVQAAEVITWFSAGLRTAFNGVGGAADTALDPNGYRIVITGPAPGASRVQDAGAGRSASAAVPGPGTPLVILVDTSGSMSDDDGTGVIKLAGAKNALIDVVRRQPPNSQVGLWTYPGDAGCSSGSYVGGAHLRYMADPALLAAEIRALSANGSTPTAAALEAVAEDLRNRNIEEATILLVSDGLSNCGPPACQAAEQLGRDGFDITVQAMGFQISEEGREELECVARATGGQYFDVKNSEELGEQLGELGVPELVLDVTAPSSVPAGSGMGIEAVVSNPSAHVITDVHVTLAFAGDDANAIFPAVIPPRYPLGNVPPGGSIARTWTLSTSGHQGTATYTVTAGNNQLTSHRSGTIAVDDRPLTLKDAGPLLRSAATDGPAVILGDSYSSGEGTGSYVGDPSGSSYLCHRSQLTYGYRLLGGPRIIACSGAVTADLLAPNYKRGVPAQLDALGHLDRPPGLALLTFGGNDVGFANIIKTCIGPGTCADNEEFVRQTFTDIAALRNTLASAYIDIDTVLNSQDNVRERGSAAPIFVLSYPQILWAAQRGNCDMLNAKEVTFGNDVVAALSAAIAEGVADARAEGVPVFHVDTVQDAVLPNHTACDDEPYINPLTVVTGGRAVAVDAIAAIGLLPAGQQQELMHPDERGYVAVTNSLVSWSQTVKEGDFPENMPANGRSETVSLAESAEPAAEVTLRAGEGTASAKVSLRSGDTIRVSVEGAMPGSEIRIVIESVPRALASWVVGEDGTADGRVIIPVDLPPGAHTLVAAGVDSDLQPLRVEQPVSVAPALPRWLPLTGGASAVALVAGMTSIFLARRRRLWPSRS